MDKKDTREIAKSLHLIMDEDKTRDSLMNACSLIFQSMGKMSGETEEVSKDALVNSFQNIMSTIGFSGAGSEESGDKIAEELFPFLEEKKKELEEISSIDPEKIKEGMDVAINSLKEIAEGED